MVALILVRIVLFIAGRDFTLPRDTLVAIRLGNTAAWWWLGVFVVEVSAVTMVWGLTLVDLPIPRVDRAWPWHWCHLQGSRWVLPRGVLTHVLTL